MNIRCTVLSTDIPDSWKYAGDGWGSSLHRICSRTGSFPPALAHYFVKKYSRRGDIVLDPFSGKGTLPLEACLNGRVGIGNDLAPEAYVITRAKVNPVTLYDVKEWICKTREKWSPESYDVDEVSDDVRVFFSKYTLRQILAIREILMDDDSDLANFIKALMCGILHGPTKIHLSIPCSHAFSMSPKYIRRFAKKNGLKKPRRDVLKCLLMKAERVLADGLPKVRGMATMEDARKLTLEDESVNLIVTSPPYFNMQTYAWDNWLRLWFLGYDYLDVKNKLFQSESKQKFKVFMLESLKEMFRVLKNNSACFVVVGDVKLNGYYINMAEMIAPIAESVGFTVARLISDSIPKSNKHLMYIKEEEGVSRERILELHKGNPIYNDEPVAWAKVTMEVFA
ncbi:MAG: DNA methyltransferase [Nitrososphaerota archaeon]|nr:DNA methyltransferase [Aigarchaeota archaeon]MDW8076471.1 DNA methyltransferase [Nitrososphaerota archaeon]